MKTPSIPIEFYYSRNALSIMIVTVRNTHNPIQESDNA